MKARAVTLGFALIALMNAWMSGVVYAETSQQAPRDIWPQATASARDGDMDAAKKKTTELLTAGRSFGIKTFPVYAASASGLARQAEGAANADLANWAALAADQLDGRSPAVAFSNADRAAERNRWAQAVPMALGGFTRVFGSYRTSVLGRADLALLAALAIAITAIVLAVALFIRYGRAMTHDFREILGKRFRGGSVTVLAFALLFLPIFLWLGPVWLVFYWLAIFFGYTNWVERLAIVLLLLCVAALPVLVDYEANRIGGVDSPVMMAAIASNEQAYQPQALRRLQELAGVTSNDPTVQLLLGNMQAFDGNEPQAAAHYRNSIAARDNAGAHVNLGNLHFLDNEFPAAITEYEAAQRLDPKLAIAFYNSSVAAGETYKFDDQARMLEKARSLDRDRVEKLTRNTPPQKIVMYHPPLDEGWRVTDQIAKKGSARSLFGNYSSFDPLESALNPVTIGALAALLLALLLVAMRRAGYAGQCIKCGRTFCHRCKSARESATYCTQCIHIYLKRDGVSLDTKRKKVEEVSDFHAGVLRRNRFFATFLPGSAQLMEGRTVAGVIGIFLFVFFVASAILAGHLAPALGPSASVAQLLVRGIAILLAVITWFFLSLPVYRRRVTT